MVSDWFTAVSVQSDKFLVCLNPVFGLARFSHPLLMLSTWLICSVFGVSRVLFNRFLKLLPQGPVHLICIQLVKIIKTSMLYDSDLYAFVNLCLYIQALMSLLAERGILN